MSFLPKTHGTLTWDPYSKTIFFVASVGVVRTRVWIKIILCQLFSMFTRASATCTQTNCQVVLSLFCVCVVYLSFFPIKKPYWQHPGKMTLCVPVNQWFMGLICQGRLTWRAPSLSLFYLHLREEVSKLWITTLNYKFSTKYSVYYIMKCLWLTHLANGWWWYRRWISIIGKRIIGLWI